MRILGTSCPPALYEHPFPDPSFLKPWVKCCRLLWGIFADLSQQVGLMLAWARPLLQPFHFVIYYFHVFCAWALGSQSCIFFILMLKNKIQPSHFENLIGFIK